MSAPTLAEQLRAEAAAALDRASADLREAARDMRVAEDPSVQSRERAAFARSAATAMTHAVRRLSNAEAFEDAARLAEQEAQP